MLESSFQSETKGGGKKPGNISDAESLPADYYKSEPIHLEQLYIINALRKRAKLA